MPDMSVVEYTETVEPVASDIRAGDSKEAKQKLGTGVFLIDERNIPSARTWYAALSGREKLVLCRKDRASFFIVTESGIVDAFYSFMEELPESGNLLRTEIAARYVDSMMEE